MSFQISKIINIYEQSLSIVKAKNQLFIDSNSEFLNQPQFPSKTSQPQFQLWTTYITTSLKYVLKMWFRKYEMFGSLRPMNSVSLQQLESILYNLKNNTTLLTKQDQLLTQIQSSISQWNETKDPLTYYDIKKRQNIKSDLTQKLSQLKTNSAFTKQSQAPMYLRKLQQQLKSTIYQIYINQINIDTKIIEKGKNQWHIALNQIYRNYKEINDLDVYNFVIKERNQFIDMFKEGLSSVKKGRVNQRLFVKYNQEFNNKLKNISKFWEAYKNSLDVLLATIRTYVRIFNDVRQDLRQRQLKAISFLDKASQIITRIFKIQMPLKAITSLNRILEILPILNRLQSSIKNIKISVEQNIRFSTQYRNSLVTNISSRQRQFYMFSLDDRNFLDSATKSESLIKKKIIDAYTKFLKDIDATSKENLRLFEKQFVPVYEAHEVGSLLNRQIISAPSQAEHMTLEKSRSSNQSTMGSKYNNSAKTIKNQKVLQIQQFLSKLYIYDPSNINWARNNIFSCALGPRLLLHGSLAIMEEGVYFQSLFNKKNLFFGRTRVFIPKTQIYQVETQNTLVIFPDAVQVKTKVGPVYFHSLGSRETISNTLNQVYFPQNMQNEGDCASQADFNEYDEKQYGKVSPQELKQLLKPHENVLANKDFKGIKLAKFFRRYFGSIPFQIRGNQYQNFRSYFLLQIEAIQPKATPITPEPPSYFSYKGEQTPKSCPKISERYHTYRKGIPKIPFLSSGGEGLCEDKQIYHWVSPQILVIDCVSKVKGFSLVQGMEILTKQIIKQEGNDVSLNVSTAIKFSTQSSTNGLLKGPAISNLKDSTLKMIQIMEKYEKGKKGRGKAKDGGNLNEENQIFEQNLAKVLQQNKRLKKRLNIVIILFVVIYILTILFIKLAYF